MVLASSPSAPVNVIMASFTTGVSGGLSNIQWSVTAQNADPCISLSPTPSLGSSTLTVLVSPVNVCGGGGLSAGNRKDNWDGFICFFFFSFFAKGAIAGIVIGCCAAVIIAFVIVLCVLRRSQQQDMKRVFGSNKLGDAK